MTSTIKLRRSVTPAATPSSLESGEIAINEADKKLFYRDGAGDVQELGLDVASDIAAAKAEVLEGGQFTGAPSVIRSQNDVTWQDVLRFLRGSGAGQGLALRTRGDAANGVDGLRVVDEASSAVLAELSAGGELSVLGALKAKGLNSYGLIGTGTVELGTDLAISTDSKTYATPGSDAYYEFLRATGAGRQFSLHFGAAYKIFGDSQRAFAQIGVSLRTWNGASWGSDVDLRQANLRRYVSGTQTGSIIEVPTFYQHHVANDYGTVTRIQPRWWLDGENTAGYFDSGVIYANSTYCTVLEWQDSNT